MDDIDLSGITPVASHPGRMRCVRFGKIAFVEWKGVAWSGGRTPPTGQRSKCTRPRDGKMQAGSRGGAGAPGRCRRHHRHESVTRRWSSLTYWTKVHAGRDDGPSIAFTVEGTA